MHKILIVEDEEHIAAGLRFNLEVDGYAVTVAHDGAAAMTALGGETFDLVVLDVMMPKMNGFEVAQAMREREDYTPILMLTALGKPEDVLSGFEAGADDYLPKPFDLNIFLARVGGLLRRRRWFEKETETTRMHPESLQFYGVNGRTIDFDNLELRGDDEVVHLTLMEARLLRYLIENEGRAVSRKTILEEVWDLREDTDTRAIDNFIVRLRKYLEDDPAKPQILQTVRGVGYKFIK
ncbi:MAG: response regulator transcription factor [Acidobacteria bacterium]|nr:response regulator transcription factor [Acidobacteriota bacterium]